MSGGLTVLGFFLGGMMLGGGIVGLVVLLLCESGSV